MPPTTPPDPWPLPELQRARRAIVVVDVVESVRLMQEDESGFIDRWRRFVNEVRTEVLPAHGGRLVKSLGDGMLLEFHRVPAAVAAASEVHSRIAKSGRSDGAGSALHLRMGVHVASVVIDALDIYGWGVNLAARLATLAKPGETVLSIEAREQLVDGLHVDAIDLGECFVKHLQEPVRAFVVQPRAQTGALARPASILPHIVVLPLTAVAAVPGAEREAGHLARVLTDDLVQTLSCSSHWSVMSRLSTAALDQIDVGRDAASKSLGADYMVAGQVRCSGGRVTLSLSVTECRGQVLIWEGESSCAAADLFDTEYRIVRGAAAEISAAVLSRQVNLAHAAALPNMPSYSLLLSAMSLLHRLGQHDFLRAHDLLDHLVQRNPRAPEAHTWLAKWFFLQIAQKRVADSTLALKETDDHLARALDADPQHALALALSGHLRIYAKFEPAPALLQLHAAVRAGPNEPMAWLFLSNALGASGDGAAAVTAADRACALSPLDPLGYYYDIFAASAYSAAGRHDRALALAQRSVERNAMHLSSWVQLIIELVLNNRMDDARRTVGKYLLMRPTASVQRFLSTHVARGTPLAERDGLALIEAGMPP